MASDTSNVLTDRNELNEMFLGILRNISSGIFTRQDTENRARNLLIHYSDFWLAYAMEAMMYWYTDERNNAETTLQKALALNREKTALFFSLFCVKKRAHGSGRTLGCTVYAGTECTAGLCRIYIDSQYDGSRLLIY